ncbi:MAG: hypothetical protein HY923_05570 [Elusimicrobia bacterium]|nr:hypothetical protein [Elusimicrobiota bacterium]
MKKAIFAAVILALAVLPARAVPKILNYQGFLTESGSPVTGTRDMTFRVFAAPTGGAALFTEVHAAANTVTVSAGNFNVLVGELTAGGIPVSVFNGDDRYMEVEVGAVILPRQRIVSVAYAIRSETASAVRPMLRFTRVKLASSGSDASKDAQCVSELGDGYATALISEVAALSGNGGSDRPNVFFTFAGTSDLWSYGDGNAGFDRPSLVRRVSGNGQIACVNKAAPVRSTRTLVAPADGDAAKDSQCTAEFGGDYAAATVLDLAAAIRGPFGGSVGEIPVIFAAETDVFDMGGTGGVIELAFSSSPPAQGPLICIRR